MQRREEVSLTNSATYYSYLSQRFSGTNPTSDLCDVHFRRTVARGHRICHHISRIRYKSSLVLHPGDTHSDRPIDFLAFSLIVYLVVRSYLQGVPIPKLLKIMVRDATYYFLFIFSSHLVVVLFQWAAFAEVSS